MNVAIVPANLRRVNMVHPSIQNEGWYKLEMEVLSRISELCDGHYILAHIHPIKHLPHLQQVDVVLRYLQVRFDGIVFLGGPHGLVSSINERFGTSMRDNDSQDGPRRIIDLLTEQDQPRRRSSLDFRERFGRYVPRQLLHISLPTTSEAVNQKLQDFFQCLSKGN